MTYNFRSLKKLLISLVSLTHILIVILILSKASADTYCRQKVPFALSGIEVQQLQLFKWIINSRLGVRFLHFAAEKNFYNIIRFLVKHGANVDAADREGNTVLHVASIFGFIEIVQTVAARTENINALMMLETKVNKKVDKKVDKKAS